MSASVPSSTQITESAVIDAPLGKVWHHIKLGSMTFIDGIVSCKKVDDCDDEATLYTWSFKDGTTLTVKQEEHSATRYFITYTVVAAEPALSYHSVLSSIRLYPVTNTNQTFITWSATFSNDAGAEAVQDAKWKRRSSLENLAKLMKQ